MKTFLKLLIALFLFVQLPANAVTFNVLVLPADVVNVCNNYYCYDEVSNIIAQDVIDNFAGSNTIVTPSIDAVRGKLAANPALMANTTSVLRKYDKANNLDIPAIKAISEQFGAKSVLLISSAVTTKNSNLRRGVWEILDLSSGFGVVYPYELETNAVLVDTVNGLVMWSGNYKKKLGNNNNEFKAKSPSEAAAKLEQLEMYSKAIAARSIAQNVRLRFFPKVTNPVVSPNATKEASPSAFFRMNSTTPMYPQSHTPISDIKGINEGDFGEIIYGL